MTENYKPDLEIESLLQRIDALVRENFQNEEANQYQESLRPKLVRTLNKDLKQRTVLTSAPNEKILDMLRKHLPNTGPQSNSSISSLPIETLDLPSNELEDGQDDVDDSNASPADVLGETSSQGVLGGLKDRVHKTGALVQKRLSLRSKESSLRDIYARIGSECVKLGIAKSQFPEDYSNLESIASQIKAKETSAKADSNDSVSGQAKGMLSSGKAKIEIESLKSQRKGLLAEIGRKSGQENHLDQQMCIDERKNAQTLKDEVAELKEAIIDLEKSTGSLKTLGVRFAIVALFGLVLLWGVSLWYFVLYAIFAVWVFTDAKKRMNHAVGWPLSTFLLGPIVLPVYLANRNLKEGEVREGGTGWNIIKYFALFWTITMVIGGIAGMVNVSDVVQKAGSEAEQAGAAIGVALGLGMMFGLWFIVLVAALVLGLFLKKSSIVEKGPTGPLVTEPARTE